MYVYYHGHLCIYLFIIYLSITYYCLCIYHVCMSMYVHMYVCMYLSYMPVCMYVCIYCSWFSLILCYDFFRVKFLFEPLTIYFYPVTRNCPWLFDSLLLSVSLLLSFTLGQQHESNVLLFIIYHRTQLELNEVNWRWSSLCSWTLQSEMMRKLRIGSDIEQGGGLKEERGEYRIQGLNFSVLFLPPRLYFQIQTTQVFWGIVTCGGHHIQSVLKEVVGIFSLGASKNCIWTKRLAGGGVGYDKPGPRGTRQRSELRLASTFLSFFLGRDILGWI